MATLAPSAVRDPRRAGRQARAHRDALPGRRRAAPTVRARHRAAHAGGAGQGAGAAVPGRRRRAPAGAGPRAPGRARRAPRCAPRSAPRWTSSPSIAWPRRAWSSRIWRPGCRRSSGRFDLIVAAHLLGRAARRPRRGGTRGGAGGAGAGVGGRLLAPGGTIVIIEPALRETSRELLAVRDLLLSQTAQPALDVVAPCFWAGPCPALERERDWCHDAAPVPSSPRVDFSYLVLRERVSTHDRRRPDAGPHRQRSATRKGKAQALRLRRHRPPPARSPRS